MAQNIFAPDRYYILKDIVRVIGYEEYRVKSAMKKVSFPEPAFRLGIARVWEKSVVEPYFPQMIAYLEKTLKSRTKAVIVADIAAFIEQRGLTKQQALDNPMDYLHWTSRMLNLRMMKKHGGWFKLVEQASKEKK